MAFSIVEPEHPNYDSNDRGEIAVLRDSIIGINTPFTKCNNPRCDDFHNNLFFVQVEVFAADKIFVTNLVKSSTRDEEIAGTNEFAFDNWEAACDKILDLLAQPHVLRQIRFSREGFRHIKAKEEEKQRYLLGDVADVTPTETQSTGQI